MHLWSQLRLAEVSPTLLHKVRATPRYDALMELKRHWPMDLRKDKNYFPAMSPAEAILVPASEGERVCVNLPFSPVCCLYHVG